MTRTDTILRLLADGPLRMDELLEITGWTPRQCRKTLGYLTEAGRITPAGQKGAYAIPAIRNACAPGLDGQHAGGEGARMAPSQATAPRSAGAMGRHAATAHGGNAQ